MYIFLQLNLYSFLVPHEALIILQRAQKRAHPRKSLSVHLKYQKVTTIPQKYYNSITLPMWAVYTTSVSKNPIVSQDVAIHSSSHIRKKIFFSLIL